MKRPITLFCLASCVTASAQTSPPRIAFDSVADALKWPKDLSIGEVSGAAVNPNN